MLYYTRAIRHRDISGKHIKLLPSTVSIRSRWTESITRALGDSRSPKMLNFGPTRLSARPFRVTTSNHFEQLKFNLTSPVTREVLIPPRMGCSLKSCSVFFYLPIYQLLSDPSAFTFNCTAGSAVSLSPLMVDWGLMERYQLV